MGAEVVALTRDPAEALERHFGFREFLDGQAEVVSALLGGRDALVVMPTGGGKSLCYQLPALVMPGVTIVVSPLIALMKDQVDGLVAKGIPAARFWSLTVYDNQSRSMLQTSQPYPRAGSQSYPSPAAVPAPDGSTTVYFAPERPDGVNAANWIQTLPGKGWFTILRLYGPLEAFFDKTWRPGEVELVK